MRTVLLSCLVLVMAACGGEAAVRPSPPRVRPTMAIASGVAAAEAAADPLGPKPEPAEPAAFTPPTPVRYVRENGMEVWLLERRGLPIVSVELVVRGAGSAADPDGKWGVAATTANMLDEGAGKLGPLELAREVDRLGASLATGARADYAFAHLTVLKRNLTAAFDLYADVVMRPQLAHVEYKRVHELWKNALVARQSEPDAVAAVVLAKKAYPAGHPYGHPLDGTLSSAAKVTLADVKTFYADRWTPDRAVLVVVGDVSRAELESLLDTKFRAWKAKPGAVAPRAPVDRAGSTERRVILVDRPDAPQSVIAVAREGIAAGEADAPVVGRVNMALGGTFTSRLNQDLREEHGWSYGAHSRFSWTLEPGLFVAQAAVHTEHTGEALKAMLADIEGMAKDGPTDAEVEMSRKGARSSLVEAFETVEQASARLGRSAGVGLPPGHEAKSAELAQRADKAHLRAVAARRLGTSAATIVIVGPKRQLEPQLKAIGITAVETTGPEGE